MTQVLARTDVRIITLGGRPFIEVVHHVKTSETEGWQCDPVLLAVQDAESLVKLLQLVVSRAKGEPSPEELPPSGVRH